MSPFLTFLTPTYRRPKGLAACLASVQAQTLVGQIQQLVIVDHVGNGIDGMFASLPAYAPAVQGQYVHLLCDDDVLAGPSVVADVRAFAGAYEYPPVILVSAQKGDSRWPAGEPWPPKLGRIDLGCLIVRADVWKAHVQDYGKRYEGDWDFAYALFLAGYDVASCCEMLFVRGGVSRGAAEAA